MSANGITDTAYHTHAAAPQRTAATFRQTFHVEPNMSNPTLSRALRAALSGSLLAACLTATAAPAATVPESALRVDLSAEASRPAANDLARATLAAEASGSTPADLAQRVNDAIATALKTAKSYPSVAAKTSGTNTYPNYKNGRIESWHMRSEIALESSDMAAFSELMGRLQTTLNVTNVQMLPSPATRRQAENEAMLDAIGQFKARAKLLSDALGKNYTIKQISVGSSGRVMPVMMRSAAKAMVAEAAPMPLEAGESQVDVTVSGTIAVE